MGRSAILISILTCSFVFLTMGCSDNATDADGEEITVKHLPEKSISLTDEAALQKMIEDLRTYPDAIDQINKNRETPITREKQIKKISRND